MTEPLPRTADGIVLRRLSPADLRAFQAYRHDAELGRFQGWAPTSDKAAAEFLRYMGEAALLQPGVWCQIGIADETTQELIGDIGLNLASDSMHAEIGFTLRREFQGRGLATAAVREAVAMIFQHTRAEKVLGHADARNIASIRLLERVGMRKLESRTIMSRGKPCTEHVYVFERIRDV